MLEWMKDDLYGTEICPFKMNPKHSQLHSRGKTKRHEFRLTTGRGVYHEPIVVNSGSTSSLLLLSYDRGKLWGHHGESYESQMSGQNGQKPA